jgi:pilus assembly protein CpaE
MTGKIISFIKSGGGVGATTLAVQIACSRHGDGIALLDLDIQYGSAAFQMDTDSNVSILDLSANRDRLDAALLQGAMARPHNAFDLLPAPEGIYPMEDVSEAAVTKIIDIARRVYAITLIDLPMVWTEWGHAALSKSDHIVLVTQLTVPSLRQARRQIEMTKRERLGHIPLFVVANRVRGSWLAPGISTSDAERALGRQINFIVPEEQQIMLAGNAGSPLSAVRGGALAKRLSRMMNEIVAMSQPLHSGET